MSYPAWPDWTEAQWLDARARQSIAKFDETKHPRDKEGQFAEVATTVHGPGKSVQLPGRYDRTKLPPKSFAITTEHGYILATQSSSDPGYYWINHIRVSDEHQGKGEGSALFRAAAAEAKRQGFTGLMRGDIPDRPASDAAQAVWAKLKNTSTYTDAKGFVHHVLKFDESKHPRDKEGQFTDSAMSAPVFKGVNPTTNAAVQVAEHLLKWKVLGLEPTPAELAATEAELHALPLVHGTTVAGAIGAVDKGLLSHADMEAQIKDLTEDMDDLKDSITNIVGEDADWGNIPFWTEDDIAGLGLERSDAKALLEYVQELQDIEKVLTGTTYEPDKALGLDQFVFMTHGAKHQDYGNVAVIIDNEVLDTGWATEHDIVATPGVKADAEWKAYEGIEEYQKTIVRGEGYYKAAAAKAGTVRGLAYRSREQLFEIKVPHVPKEAVRGFMVDGDLDTAQRLADKLAARRLTNRVLFTVEAESSEARRRFVRQQLRHIQETGMWDEGAVEAFNDEHGGVYLL